MFLAKIIDQKQGEARVVDHKQILRDRLDEWLKTRPSAADLANRGILDRGHRYAFARNVVDQFFRARAQAQAAEAVRIPAGTFEYSDRVLALLAGLENTGAGESEDVSAVSSDVCETLDRHLISVRNECETIRGTMEAADQAWASAAEECQKTLCTSALKDAAKGANRAMNLLEAHRTSTGDSLADVFSDLREFQRLATRRSCLEGIVAVVEKTDAVRQAIFSCRGASQVPFSTLEELPELCAALPSRSQGIGVKRLQFLISPLRTMISQELQDALKKTEQWPLDPKKPPAKTSGSANAETQVIKLIACLQRVQHVHGNLSRRVHAQAVEEDADEVKGPWACSVLARPLIAWFRRLFQKPELCRMDKPEWAFQYIVKIASDYGALLEKWLAHAHDQSGPKRLLDSSEVMALQGLDLAAGLAGALACEARLLIRTRMPLLAEPEARPTLLHTLRHLVKFHGEIAELGGHSAAVIALADFDANRPLHEPKPGDTADAVNARQSSGDSAENSHARVSSGSPPRKPEASSLMDGLAHLNLPQSSSPSESMANNNSSGFMGGLAHLQKPSGGADTGLEGGFMSGLSHLRKSEPESNPEPEDDPTLVQLGAELFGGGREKLRSGLSHVAENRDNILTGLTHLADAVVDVANHPDRAQPTGFLDVWIAADAEFIAEKLQKSVQPEGNAWKRKSLRLAMSDSTKEEAEVAELATLMADLFDKSRARAEVLTTNTARGAYADRVIGAGLRQVLETVRERWNALSDPVSEAREAAFLLETLEEICRFLDHFPLGAHFVAAVDDTSTLRIGMMDKLADSLVATARPVLRQLHTDSCCFSYTLAPPFMVLLRRLRPSLLLVIAQKGIRSLADMLLKHLLWHAPFEDKERVASFISNCRDDLRSILISTLDASELTPLQPLWDGCSLLTLPHAEAVNVLAALRKVARCSPSHALKSIQSKEPENDVEDSFELPVVGEVLRQRRAEIFAAAGIKDLSVPDAITVLGKRPDLVGSLSDLQDTPLGVLQAGAGALQQLHGAPIPAAAIASSAVAAAGAAHAAAEKARIASTQLRGRLPGRLISSVGAVASRLRPLGAARDESDLR